MKKLFRLALCLLVITTFFSGNISVAAESKVPAPPSGLTITTPDPPPGPIEPPPPLGNDGMLSGMTPGNYKIPSGWSIVRTQNFEGTRPSDETWGNWNGSVSATKPHTGSRSIEGTYSNDQANVSWQLDSGKTGSFTDLYISFYEWISPSALFNDEFFLASVMKRGSDGNSQEQHWFVDWYWAPTYNNPSAYLYILGESNTSNGNTYRRSGKLGQVHGGGNWIQWEIWWHQNSPGSSNGFCRVYRNGNLYTYTENQNLNGTVNMSNAQIQVGGVYTMLVWMKDYPSCTRCGNNIGDGTDACTGSKGWWGQAFGNPICQPSIPSFKRYIDDIIIMKK